VDPRGRTADARNLCEQLVNLGIVVRDQSGQQCWRRTDRPVEP